MATEVAVHLPLCHNSAWAHGPPRLPENQGSAPLKWKLAERAPRSQEEKPQEDAGKPLCNIEESSVHEDLGKPLIDGKLMAAGELQVYEVLEVESNDAQEKIVGAADIECSGGLLEPSASSPCHDVND